MASYERIFERTGISERDIRKAISLMITSGLLVSVDRDHKQMLDKNEPNKYYLAGYHVLIREASSGETGAKPIGPAGAANITGDTTA